LRITRSTRLRGFFALVLFLLIASTQTAPAQQRLSAEQVGPIGDPTGRIAFVRSGSIWVMKVDGSAQQKVTDVSNADGRLSFSPDNRRIVFTRSGEVDLRGPDMLGGKHKVYDLFMAYLDSLDAGNSMWWMRITDDLGSRDPEWLPDGRIIFTKDMNANLVNAAMPNYQIVVSNDEGGSQELLRKDWQNMSEFLMNPTVNPKTGDIAFVHFFELKPQGIAVLNEERFMAPLDSIRKVSTANNKRVAPSFSPDGKWLAYVYNDMNKAGIYITTPDLKEHYLVWSPPVNVYPRSLAPSFSPDSKWLTFATTDGSIWICDITGNQARRITVPGSDSAPAWSKAPKK
jgi:Tol biopolymer transport system component